MSKKLSVQQLNSNMDAGRHYDDSGTGLHIYVRKSGSKSWSQKIRFGGKQIELGLGNYPMVSLAEARRVAAENKAMAAKGTNPKLERTKPTTIPSFREVVELALPSILDELKNDKHRAQWRTTLETYALPLIGKSPVNEITVNEVHDVLKPIWKDKTETASRLRGRVERVLDYAIATGMMQPPNPAAWQGNLSALLPSKNKIKIKRNHPALQLNDAQRWWNELKQRDGTGASALMLLAMTASRSGEIRGMRWEEVKLFDDAEERRRGYVGIWTRPASRMKAKREHRVPITKQMFDLLNMSNNATGLVFKSQKLTTLSDMTLSALMKRMNASDELGYIDQYSHLPAVPHGLRSTFRDWVAETGQSREAAELQLAHKFGSEVEHAYYRTDLLDERARLLTAWFNFLENRE
ncbi:MAG: integrase arm-type DNA-binding domain-containing protein [Betaproteobacteria bacterium]|nr:integrase arm-type DNA-binding domain-containing protein [Betaproteobacteria bacterium]